MTVELPMPRLSDAMTEGLIVRWIKAPGDELAEGEELVEIETDKATMVYESDRAGILIEIVVAEGETVAVGAAIARIGDDSAEVVADVPSGSGGADDPPSSPAVRTAPPAPAAVAVPSDRVKASPLARRIAAEAGIDLITVQGSGPGGRISKQDVEALLADGNAPAPTPAPATPQAVPAPSREAPEVHSLSRLQALVAKRVSEAKAVAPHFYLETTIDMTETSAALARLKQRSDPTEGRPPSVNDAVVKASAIALRSHPKVNGAYRDGHWELYPEVNIGVAVAADEALLVPVLRDADRLGIREIAARSRALAESARDGTLTPRELDGGTFTISNLGMYGIERFHAVINGGQAAILAVGAVTPSVVPTADESTVEVRRLMSAALSCDHRILSGAEGAEFLQTLRRVLEEPLRLSE